MKIKVLEVSDEVTASRWKFGDRVKVTKILVTIKHLTTQEVEEGEFDIEAIEHELAEKRALHVHEQMDSRDGYKKRLRPRHQAHKADQRRVCHGLYRVLSPAVA